jgi:drug/metabolite transporter (DMT)-like permease
VLRGVLGAVANVSFYLGIERAGPGLAMVLHSTYPVFTAMWAVVLLGERMTARVAAALGLNLVGVWLALGDRAVGGPAVVSGVFFSLAGGVIAGTSVTTISWLRRSESATLIATWFMAVAVVLTAPVLLLGMPASSVRLGWALLGVILTSAGGQWLLHQGLGFTTATSGSLAAATSVVTAAALGAVMLDEPIGTSLAGAGVLMVVAVGLAAPRVGRA